MRANYFDVRFAAKGVVESQKKLVKPRRNFILRVKFGKLFVSISVGWAAFDDYILACCKDEEIHLAFISVSVAFCALWLSRGKLAKPMRNFISQKMKSVFIIRYILLNL